MSAVVVEASQPGLAIDAVRRGGVVVLPTDTVYGVGCLATDADAVSRVLAAKGRGRQMPPPVLVADAAQVRALPVEIPATAGRLMEAFWPGGLTLILKLTSDLGWDLGDLRDTVAVRVPDLDVTRAILAETGPMAVTSANLHDQPPATDVHEAIAQLGDSVDLYVDGGPTPGPTASSIVDLSVSPAHLIRSGTLAIEELRAKAGVVIE